VFWWHRADGELVKDGTDLRRVMPYVMRSRNESVVYFEQRIDVRNAERFLRAFNEAHPGTRAGLFHVVLWASRQGMAEFPALNRFVAGGRLYQRDGIWVSYSAKQRMKRGAPLLVLKRKFEPDESFADVVAAMGTQLQSAKFGGTKSSVDSELGLVLMLPGFLRRVVFAAYRMLEALGMFPRVFIDNDPLYGSMFLTDLGSLGMDPAYHHLYEYGTIGIFGALGRARTELVGDPNTGRLEKRRMATVRWSFDERVEDGLYAGYGLKHMQRLVEDPVKGGIAADDEATLALLGANELDLTAVPSEPAPVGED
jgi:hypothetical protein